MDLKKILENVEEILGHDAFDVIISPRVHGFEVKLSDWKNGLTVYEHISGAIQKETLYFMAEKVRGEASDRNENK